MSYCAGVDVGGTTTTVSIGAIGQPVGYVSEQFPTHALEGPSSTIRAIAEHLSIGMQAVGAKLEDLTAVGLSTPGPATLDGVLLKTPNFNPEHWDRFPIRGALEESLQSSVAGLRVFYIGDGQAAALGEFSVRTGRLQWSRGGQAIEPNDQLSSLFMVIVGTGLGGGEIRDGKVVRGKEGRAGHAGHLLLPEYAFRYAHDRQLVVGNARSTVESAVSLTGLTHQLGYRLQLEQWLEHPLNKTPGSLRDKAKQLRTLADHGDELALELFDDQARALGLALLTTNYLGDYDLLVIGGGVCDLSTKVRDRYRSIAEAAYREHALDGFRNSSHFEFSACGDEAPVLGALAHAFAEL